MGHVVFTRPHQLDRLAHRLGDLRCLHDEVQLDTTTETATQESGLHRDVFRLEAQHRSHSTLRALLELGRANQGHLAVEKVGREVHGLKRRVRLHGGDVLGLDDLGSTLHGISHIAHGLGDLQHLSRADGIAGAIDDRSGGNSGACALVPLHDQGLAGLDGLPVRVGHDSHAVVDLHHINHTGHGFGFRAIKALDLATNHGALLQAGVHHAGQLHIHTELGRAVDLGGRIQTGHSLADNAEVFRIFDRDFLGHGQLGSCSSQATVGGFFAVGAQHHAVLSAQGGAVDFPLSSCGGDQHLTHLRAAGAQFFPAVTHRGRATGDLCAQQGVHIHRAWRCNGHFDLVDAHIELFSNQHGHGGVNALTHLGTGREDGDGVVIGNVYPCIGGVHHACSLCFVFSSSDGEAHHQATGDHRGGLDEVATCSFHGHVISLSAHGSGSVFDGSLDAAVSAATADVAAHGSVDVSIAGVLVAGQQSRSAHELTRLAVTALGHIVLDPGFLQGVAVVFGQALNRGHFRAGHRSQGGGAGTHRLAVDVHGTSTAQSGAATKLGAGHAEFITQDPQQRGVGLGLGADRLAVDF